MMNYEAGSDSPVYLIPHPERVFCAVQNSWCPREWQQFIQSHMF